MSKQLYSNTGASYVSGAVGSGDTTITVQDGSSFPSGGNFTCRLDNEYVLCTSRSTNVLTVTRAQEGTSAVSHAVGAILFHCITDASLRKLGRQSKGGTLVAERREANFIEGQGIALTLTDQSGTDACDVQIDVKLPTFAGTPTGTPANGTLALDTTNHRLYVYDSGWKYAALT